MLLLLGGGIAFYFFRKGTAAQKLLVNLVDLKLSRAANMSLPVITAYFKIINPSSTAIVLTSLAGEIFINNSPISTVQNLSNTVIPANNSITLPVTINTTIFSAAQTIFNLFKNKQKLKIDFRGTANSEGLLVPINNTLFIQS